MSAASFIIILFLGKNFLSNRTQIEKFIVSLSLLCVFVVFINIGYFVKFGEFELSYEEFLTAVVGIQALFLVLRLNIDRKLFLYGSLLIMVIILGMFLAELFPYGKAVLAPGTDTGYLYFLGGSRVEAGLTAFSFRYLLRVTLIVLIFFAGASVIGRKELDQIADLVVKFSVVCFAYCFFEFICKNMIHSDIHTSLLNLIFNFRGGGLISERAGNLYPLMGMKYEPAQLSEGLWMLGLITIFSVKSNKVKTAVLAGSIFIILVSGSLKGLGFAFGLMLLYIIFVLRPSLKTAIFIIAGGMFVAAVCFSVFDLSYYTERLDNTFRVLAGDGFTEFNSENVRTQTVQDAMGNFMDRPLLGLGLGVVFAYGALPMCLSNIGIIGFGLWLMFLARTSKIKPKGSVIAFIMIICFMYFLNGSITLLYNPVIFITFIAVGRCSEVIEKPEVGLSESGV